jgi:hypothetical protein
MRLINASQVGALLLAVLTSLSLHASGIHNVDFKNFEYPWDQPSGDMTAGSWLDTSAATTVRLSDGVAEVKNESDSESEPGPFPSLRLTRITYGALGPHGKEAAAITLNYNTGGTANWDYLYVYELERGSPKLLGRLQSGSRAYGGLVRVAIRNGALVLDFADVDKRIGDCCSTGYIRVTYTLKAGRFVESAPRTRGDLAIQMAVPK